MPVKFTPTEAVKRDERKAAQRHQETGAHGVFVRNQAHEIRQDRAADHGSHHPRRGELGLFAQSANAQREVRWIHDGHEKET